MGRFVPDLYGVARNAFFVRPDSRIHRLSDLADVPVAVGIMAGSHFTALHALELVLPRERIKIENVGGPGRRLEALLAGEVEVANLLDPEISIAEAKGMRMIAAGEFRTLFWVSPGIPQAALDAYFRVLRTADAMLRSQPERWLPLWARNVPAALGEDHDYSKFGLGELLVFERYPEDTFGESVAFAKRWGLDGNMQDSRYSALAVALS